MKTAAPLGRRLCFLSRSGDGARAEEPAARMRARIHGLPRHGRRMLDALAFGPDFAVHYIRSHRLCAKDEWTDPVWADGGALVDLDERRLLFFGDELTTTMPERRAMLGVLALTWPD